MSTVPIKSYRKTSIERRRLYLDYSCFLEETESLANFQVTVTPFTEASPVVVSNGFTDAAHKKLTMFVSGGVGNTNYTLQMVVGTSAGQVKQDNIGLVVMP